jgi:hypothetical protein
MRAFFVHKEGAVGYIAQANVGSGNSRQECWRGRVDCGAMQACSTSKELCFMKALQRRNLSFDTRSVMLFAALSLGAVAASQAQVQTSPSSPSFGPAEKSSPQNKSQFSLGPSSNASATAFVRADTNKDGQLSAQEAAKLPAIGQRFKELDTDKNGSLSRDEFEKGANS